MTIGSASSLDRQGKLLVAYSNDDGSTIGVEFAATTQKVATAVFGICASTLGESTGRLVSSAASSDTLMKSTDGGDNMETRIAVLEADVAHIKKDVSDLKAKASSIETIVNSVDKNMAVVLERLDGIKESLSKKPSTDAVEKRISDAKLAIILTVPAIIAVGTALYKGAMFLYHQG
ncbi:hypothetical protein [Rahnella sp. ChDrAdgB13]|uniref:hypothetical protein n=1 Tax=Rahnella sp. ChDrAdgB13 TaxID=1850581 RepID=UPI001FCBCE68|nr:hypothetical protein [Rahnella sp. ChDrAdgB13]